MSDEYNSTHLSVIRARYSPNSIRLYTYVLTQIYHCVHTFCSAHGQFTWMGGLHRPYNKTKKYIGLMKGLLSGNESATILKVRSSFKKILSSIFYYSLLANGHLNIFGF